MNEKKRIEWLDSMRGFTMLMVVAYHSELMAFQETEKTSLAVALVVTAFCLLTSNILRISPFYSEHLFGRKADAPKTRQENDKL